MKQDLQKQLSRVQDFENPRISLEQYRTPIRLAADLLFTAYMNGDIEDKKVVDLGTGTGLLAIGAALLGSEVIAIDKDKEALKTAEENAKKLGVSESIEFKQKTVEEFSGEFDTTVMNPPFSVHTDSGLDFFRKATEISDTVYSVALTSSKAGIKKCVESNNFRLVEWEDYMVKLPATYGFHTKESRQTSMSLTVIKQNGTRNS